MSRKKKNASHSHADCPSIDKQYSNCHDKASHRNPWGQPVPNNTALVEELLVKLGVVAVEKCWPVLPEVRRRTHEKKEHKHSALKTKDGTHGCGVALHLFLLPGI
jgi:hypothetical protein